VTRFSAPTGLFGADVDHAEAAAKRFFFEANIINYLFGDGSQSKPSS